MAGDLTTERRVVSVEADGKKTEGPFVHSAETAAGNGETRADRSADTAPGSTAEGTEPESSDEGVAQNYRWWREHGSEWVEEYDRRKRFQPRFHIQELMLVEYMAMHTPAKVLEFGCGVGRHLRNLDQLPGIEVHGYDQSSTMAAGCKVWASDRWISERVRIGPPTGRLPYEDGAFDIVYTSEVLVHVRPEDLGGMLRELIRVARGQILHLEPSPHYYIHADAHEGCWNHDLVAAYRRLGRECRMLPAGYYSQTPYRVVLGRRKVYDWNPVTLALLRRLERDLVGGLDNLRRGEDAVPVVAARQEAQRLRERLERQTAQAEQEQRRLSAEVERATAEAAKHAAELEGARREADEAKRTFEQELNRLNKAVQERGDREAALRKQAEEAASKAAMIEQRMRERLEAAAREEQESKQRIDQLRTETTRLERERERLEEELAASRDHSVRERERVEDLRRALARQIRIARETADRQDRRWSDQRRQLAELAAKQRLFVQRARQILQR